MAQKVPHVVQVGLRLEQRAGELPTQIVEMQVDGAERRPRLWCQLARLSLHPDQRLPVANPTARERGVNARMGDDKASRGSLRSSGAPRLGVVSASLHAVTFNTSDRSLNPLRDAHTAAELLIVFGDNPDWIRSEAAFAKLCGACPIPASSGMTTGRHRLNRGGHRHANAALYRAVIVRMQFHQPTRDYVARRIAAGRTKRDIIRCLKRFLAREIYQRVMTDFRARQEIIQAA